MQFVQVVFGPVDGMGDDFGYHVVGQQAEVAPLQLLVGERLPGIVVKLPADVGLLPFVRPLNQDVAEPKRRQVVAVGEPATADIVGRDAPLDASFDGVHQADGTVVAYVVQLLQAVEVE